jgi:hypothetical protein
MFRGSPSQQTKSPWSIDQSGTLKLDGAAGKSPLPDDVGCDDATGVVFGIDGKSKWRPTGIMVNMSPATRLAP